MNDEVNEPDNYGDQSYASWDELDFSTVTMGLKGLPFFEDDLYLGMQAMNVGIADAVVTEYEYDLRGEWLQTERTPTELAMAVSALSQMWVYGLYEVLRMWRDRRFQFGKLIKNGGVELSLESPSVDGAFNLTAEIRREQLRRYATDEAYRSLIDETWTRVEPVYRLVELFRINLAKHCAPGKDRLIPRAPGYGRINFHCGALDYELISTDGHYKTMNRRDIADALRNCLR